jgi:hypothetical protein
VGVLPLFFSEIRLQSIVMQGRGALTLPLHPEIATD